MSSDLREGVEETTAQGAKFHACMRETVFADRGTMRGVSDVKGPLVSRECEEWGHRRAAVPSPVVREAGMLQSGGWGHRRKQDGTLDHVPYAEAGRGTRPCPRWIHACAPRAEILPAMRPGQVASGSIERWETLLSV